MALPCVSSMLVISTVHAMHLGVCIAMCAATHACSCSMCRRSKQSAPARRPAAPLVHSPSWRSSHAAAYDKRKYMWKLLYTRLLGYDVDFGVKNASDLIAAPGCAACHSPAAVPFTACLLLRQQHAAAVLYAS